MRNIIVCLILLIGSSAGRMAAEYKEGLLYDLTGDVKDMKLDTKCRFQKKHVKFAPDGKCKLSMTYFDGENYPLGYEMSGMGLNLTQKVEYDDQKRVSKVTTYSSQGGGITETVENHYAQNPEHPLELSGCTYTVVSKKGEGRCECTYSAYEYDDHGNWIRRNVRQTDYPGTADEQVTEYAETRKIIYY